MYRLSPAYLLIAACVLVFASPTRADWTRFRGPNGSGIDADGQSTPVRWGPSANVKWKTELPGAGVSCPIVVGDLVYVTCYSGYGLDRANPGDQKNLKRHLVCMDRRTGKQIWSKSVDAVLPEDAYEGVGVTAHGYASSTPVSDGENVYVFFGKTGVLAFDKDGKQLWQTNVGKESDPRRYGSASSPILYKNLLIVPATAEREALIGLDAKTGKEIWRQEAAGFSQTWGTPILVDVDKSRTDLVIGVVREIWGLNPQTGKLRWYCKGSESNTICSSVVAHGGVIYAVGGRGGGSLAVRVGGKGDVTSSHVLWTGRDSSRFSTPILYQGRLYSFANDVASIIDAKTGERLARSRLDGGSGGSSERRMGGDYGSPILADGKVYFVRQSGDMFVMKADDKLEQLAVNRLTTAENEEFSATPAISGGELFIRSNKRLYCVAAMGQTPKTPEAGAVARGPSAESGGEASAEGGRGAGRGDGEGRRRGRRGEGGRRGRMFERSDANKDGKLSGDEIPERMRGMMDQLDKDKDGAVSQEEFSSGIGRMFGGRGRGGRGGNPREGRPERPQRPALEE